MKTQLFSCRSVAVFILVVIIAAAVSAALSSCVHFHGADGTTFTAVGTNASSVRAGDLSITDMNQSEGLREVGSAVGSVTQITTTGRLVGKGIDGATKVSSSIVKAASN